MASISIYYPKAGEPPFLVKKIIRQDIEYFKVIGMIPAAQHFVFTNANVTYLGRVFYVLYKSDEEEAKHNEAGFDVLFENYVQK